LNRQVPWLRVFVEGVVIVLSILLAFGIEAGWSERQERADEADAIAQLVTDFRAHDWFLRMMQEHEELRSRPIGLGSGRCRFVVRR